MTTETIIAPSKPELKKPSLYSVMIIDDDISTTQCVIDILINYFNKTGEVAYDLTMDVHFIGNAVAGIYPKDIAETKIALAYNELDAKDHPLRIELIECI